MALKRYVSKFKPYNHQVTANSRLWQKKAFALLMAMRTGKTKVILDDWGRMVINDMCQDLAVIAPAGVYKTWLTAIDDHLNDNLRREASIYLWEASAVSQIKRKREQAFLDRTNPRILLIDIEALSTVDRARDCLMAFVNTRRVVNVTIDESTAIKDPDSRRATFVNDKVRPYADYRRIMSGLPAPNSPFDVWSQFYFLDPNILGDSYVNHKNHYAEIDKVCMVPNAVIKSKLQKRVGNNYIETPIGKLTVGDLSRKQMLTECERLNIYIPQVPVIKKYKNEDELAKIIAPHSYRVRLEDCYDMPPKVYMRRDVELTKEQRRIYDDLRTKSMAELQSADFVTPNMVITRLLRMHQVLCGHVKDDEGKEHEIKENRTGELMGLLEEYDGKAIIWCSYDLDVRKVSDALRKRYGDESVARFWGGNTKTREDEEKLFKRNPRTRWMIATASAGGRGRTWSEANMMVYYSNTNNLEHRMQSEERGEGVGKTIPMVIVDLVAPNTVDEKLIHALRKKLTMATVINGDNYKEWLI